MNDFNLLFPGFLSAAHALRSLLLPVAFVLIVTGLILSVANAGQSIRGLLTPIAKVAIFTTLLVQLPVWGGELSRLTNDAIVNTLGANPAEVNAKYQRSLQAQQGTGTNGGWWGNLFDASASFFESMISGVLYLMGMLAGVIVFYAYLTQTFILYLGYALSPIFIGFLGLRGLSSIGSNFLLGLIGVICWPLGWGCASLLTDGLISFMADRSFLSFGASGALGYGLQSVIGIAAIALWLIVSTIAAPVIIQKAIASGSQAGSAFLSSLSSAGVAAASAGLTTGASVAGKLATSDGSSGALGAGGIIGGTAAMAAMIGSSLSGSTYSPTAGMIGSVASMIRPRDPKSNTPKDKEYRRDDPANDRQVEETLKRSRL